MFDRRNDEGRKGANYRRPPPQPGQGKRSLSLGKLPDTIELDRNSSEIRGLINNLIDRNEDRFKGRDVRRRPKRPTNVDASLSFNSKDASIKDDADEIKSIVANLIDSSNSARRRKELKGLNSTGRISTRYQLPPAAMDSEQDKDTQSMVSQLLDRVRSQTDEVKVQEPEHMRFKPDKGENTVEAPDWRLRVKRSIPVVFLVSFPILYILVFLRVQLDLPIGTFAAINIDSISLFLILMGILAVTGLINGILRYLTVKGLKENAAEDGTVNPS